MDKGMLRKQVADSVAIFIGCSQIRLLSDNVIGCYYTSKWDIPLTGDILMAEIFNFFNPKSKIKVKYLIN